MLGLNVSMPKYKENNKHHLFSMCQQVIFLFYLYELLSVYLPLRY